MVGVIILSGATMILMASIMPENALRSCWHVQSFRRHGNNLVLAATVFGETRRVVGGNILENRRRRHTNGRRH